MAEDKIVVYDDDPTGIQTVHDTIAYTCFDYDTLKEAFESKYRVIFLSTNSRSMSSIETENLHRKVTRDIFKASKETGKSFTLISRGDSTLRGHYPLETDIISEVYKENGIDIDGEIICPFLDKIRKTENDIHYVKTEDGWLECGKSEFAKDPTFGYESSDLKDYVKEKYGCDKSFISVPAGLNKEEIQSLLEKAENGVKIIINALNEDDVRKVCEVLRSINKTFIYRTAATFVKEYAQIEDRDYLKTEDLLSDDKKGRLIVAGSYVRKTSRQLEDLKKHIDIEEIEYNPESNTAYSYLISSLINEGKDVLFYTSRKLRHYSDDPVEQLKRQRQMSLDFTGILNRIEKPSLLISKGGITSYDVLTNGLMSKKVYVLGQVLNAVPVVRIMDGPFKDLKVIVFPGNVGDDDSLTEIMI
ncbi:MAG: four-carbon acid sugar kinase family protein [Erysipelotrichaceae bacterium]|nr:four-carbon acid sugar kinase family protein [Erysipelotrichaceae bacterium]